MILKVLRRPGREAWYIRGTINGVRYEETTGTTDKKIADRYRIKREHEIHAAAINGRASTATFAEAVVHYLEQGGNRRFMRPVVLHFGNMRLADIGQEQIVEGARKLYPKVQASTLNRQVYSPVSAVLHHAAALGWCPAPIIKRPKTPTGRVRWLSRWDAQSLVAAARPHMKPLIYFLFLTGARAGEALWLDWANVDLERKQVQFLDTKNGTNRGVPLHPILVTELSRMEHRTGAVFRQPNGSAYTKPRAGQWDDVSAGSRIKTAFQSAVRRAGLADFHPHDCRHTWATWHYMANRDVGALMKLGGWKSIQMVMRYAHTNVDELSHTIDAL